jgi:glycosyltransferase involved in cell wall biosynthesis
MRILIVCRMIDNVAGGVERSAVTILNGLAARGHEVFLLTWDRAPARAYYPLADAVTWYRLDMGDPSRSATAGLRLRRMARIRSWVQRTIRPDVVVGFQHGPFLTVALSLLATGRPVIAAERNAPDRLDHLRAGRRRNLLFQSFRLATRITVQMDSYVTRYPRFLRARLRVVPNIVAPAEARADCVGASTRRVLLSVGRLGYQKNPACLLRAFAGVAPKHPEWVLRFVGDGEDRESLRREAADLGLADRTEFPGPRPDIEREYADAQLFALASRWEGFPNAVAEALAHGLPVVGFAGCAGLNDLVAPERNGVLAPGNGDAEALAAALDRLMGDAELRARLGQEGISIIQTYRPERVLALWEDVLTEAAHRRGRG